MCFYLIRGCQSGNSQQFARSTQKYAAPFLAGKNKQDAAAAVGCSGKLK